MVISFLHLRKATIVVAVLFILSLTSCAGAPTDTVPTPTATVAPTVTNTPTPAVTVTPHATQPCLTFEDVFFDGEFTQEKLNDMVRSVVIASGHLESSPFSVIGDGVYFTDDGKFMLFLDKQGEKYKDNDKYIIPVNDVFVFLDRMHFGDIYKYVDGKPEKLSFSPENVSFAEYEPKADILILSELPNTSIQVHDVVLYGGNENLLDKEYWIPTSSFHIKILEGYMVDIHGIRHDFSQESIYIQLLYDVNSRFTGKFNFMYPYYTYTAA